MDDHDEKNLDELENEAKFKIIQLEDESDDEKKRILDDAKDEITKLYLEFRNWLNNNVNSQEVSERLARVKVDSADVFEKTKDKLRQFSNRDEVKAGKDKLEKVGNKVANCVSEGIQDVMKNEYVSKAVDTIAETVDSIKNDKRVKQGVKDVKKGTLKVAESAFNGLKRVLNTEDEDDDSQKKG